MSTENDTNLDTERIDTTRIDTERIDTSGIDSTDSAPTQVLQSMLDDAAQGSPEPEAEPEPAPSVPVGAPAYAPPVVKYRTAPRAGTIVWGFIIAAVGALVIALAAGLRFDVGLAAIYLLAAAGAVLIVASIASALRRKDSEPAVGQPVPRA